MITGQEYLDKHGISVESVEKFKILHDDGSLSFPVLDEVGEFLFTKTRNLRYLPKEERSPEQNDLEEFTKKYKNEVGSHATLFNYHNIKNSEWVVICEGEMDAIRLCQEGLPAISGTGGEGVFDKSWGDLLKDKKVYICYDNDAPGKKGVDTVLKILPNSRVIQLPEGSKDVCEFFYAGDKTKDFIQLIRNALTLSEWQVFSIPEEYSLISAEDLSKLEIETKPWLVKNILYSEGFCFIYGAEATGKSFISLSIAKAVATGESWLDHFETKQGNVLILDKENPQTVVQNRSAGMGVNQPNIYWLKYPEKFNLNDGEKVSPFANALSKMIIDRGISLIVLDSFIDFMVGSENSAEDTVDFFNTVKELYPQIAILAIHHENKPTQGVHRTSGQRLRGSTNINAQVMTAFRVEQVAKSKTEFFVQQTKARDTQRMDKFMIRMSIKELDNKDTVVTGFEYMGEVAEQVGNKNKTSEAEDFIMEVLSTSGCEVSRKELIEECLGKGFSQSTVEDALSNLYKEKAVEKVANPDNKREVSFVLKEPIVVNEVFDGGLGV